MGPFPHDAPAATISADNPMGTDGFEFVEYAHPQPEQLHALFKLMASHFREALLTMADDPSTREQRHPPAMIPHENLFDPSLYRSVRKPLLEAETLPPACYTDEAFFKREIETIFMREWNFIGRADYIPNAGAVAPGGWTEFWVS